MRPTITINIFNFLTLLLLISFWTDVQGQFWYETQKVVSDDRAASDLFGASVAVWENYAIVGAYQEDHDVDGLDSITSAGAAYIFEKDLFGSWRQVQKVVASDRDRYAFFGMSVSIYGNYAIVGAPGKDLDQFNTFAGAAYVYERGANGGWSQVQKILADDANGSAKFGISVSLSKDVAIIGAHEENRDESGTNIIHKAGAAYIFEKDLSGNWNQFQKIVESDRGYYKQFGTAVSISDGFILVGSRNQGSGAPVNQGGGAAYIFTKDSMGHWYEKQKIVGADIQMGEDFGGSVSILNGRCIVGAQYEEEDATGGNALHRAGAAYIFEKDSNGNWSEAQKIVASDRGYSDRFGAAVSISGEYVMVSTGTVFNNPVYIYHRSDGGIWNEVQRVVSSDSSYNSFGSAVSISGNQCIIGAHSESTDEMGLNPRSAAGASYFLSSVGNQPNTILGSIYADANSNCMFDSSDYGLGQIIVKAGSEFYGITDSLGKFTIQTDSGLYKVKQVIPKASGLLINQVCPINPKHHTVHFDSFSQDTSGLEFFNDIIECPILTVDIASARRRRCSKSTTTVKYCNNGYVSSDSVKVGVQFPEYISFLNADMAYNMDSNSNFTFEIGVLEPGECGIIRITDSVNCVPGIRDITQCTKAWITPANTCVQQLDTAIQRWDQSFMAVKGTCEGDTVKLTITNTGSTALGATEYRIYADGLLIGSDTIQLNAGETRIISIRATGQTIRVEVDQRPGTPGSSYPSATIEACGSTVAGIFSTGIVNQLPMDDEDVAREEHCLVITDSYDPNDKLVQPTGITDAHIVRPGITLDYTIRFQNTGNDTAYKVIIVDTLSEHFDIATIQFGVSSHPYELNVSGKGSPVLIFTFNDIYLPDSTTDELNSNGFVKFKMAPYDTLPNGTEVHNAADIYFDFNDPIRTNDPWVTISDIVIKAPPLTTIKQTMNENFVIYPNPAHSLLIIEAKNSLTEQFTLSINDLTGRSLSKETMTLSKKQIVDVSRLTEGIYLLRIQASEREAAYFKFVKMN